jgi:hypothetical protein
MHIAHEAPKSYSALKWMKDQQLCTTGAETARDFCRINVQNIRLSLRFLKHFNGLSFSRLSLSYISSLNVLPVKQWTHENKKCDKFNFIIITDTLLVCGLPATHQSSLILVYCDSFRFYATFLYLFIYMYLFIYLFVYLYLLFLRFNHPFH